MGEDPLRVACRPLRMSESWKKRCDGWDGDVGYVCIVLSGEGNKVSSAMRKQSM